MAQAPACADYSAAAGEQLGGSATSEGCFLFVAQPLPWAEKVQATPDLPPAVLEAHLAALKARALHRLQLVVPDPADAAAGLTRVIGFRRAAPPFGSYTQHEYRVAPARVPDLIRALTDQPDELPEFAGERVPDRARHLFVCGHAARDACCGRLGPELEAALRGAGGPGVRLWRTSHLGGHRYAPNLLDLPSGRLWGRLTADLAAAVVAREGMPPALRDCYRGWCALETPAEQVLEAEWLLRVGWRADGLHYHSAARDLEPGRWSVSLQGHRPEGGLFDACWGVVAEAEPVATYASCGDEKLAPVKQYRLESFEVAGQRF